MRVFGLPVCGFVSLFLVQTPATADAAPILYSHAQAFAQNQDVIGFPIDSDNTGILTNQDSAGPVDAAIGLVSAMAYVLDGVIGAEAFAGSLAVGGIQGQVATSQGTYADTLTLTSTTLATGTVVNLQFGVVLDATTTETTNAGVQIACGTAVGALSFNVVGGTAEAARAQETSCVGLADSNTGGTFQFAIGDEITVTLQLLATANARAGGTASADAANSLNLLAVPLGDFSYTTLSGNTYFGSTGPAPVPEPATLSLLGLGLAGVVARRRMKRR